ncbi:MAG: transglutaminase-like cysteine peptidase [Proteobacteria bacterium]|nr:transglutaminase-like cysteine peptidase [Pseudomonadota bacterium]
MHALRCGLSIATMILAGSLAAPAAAQSMGPAQPAARRLVEAPPGFLDSCRRYPWFCTNRTTGAAPLGQADLLELAARINRRVNRAVSQLSDPENYGVADYWTLPANGNGDCEDFVLQKYKLLLDAGVDSRDLSIAVVLDRQGDNHAVLVLRHGSGDLVLDSLTRRIRPWNRTGYTFLAMQSGDDKTRWEVVINQPRDSNVLARR